MKSGALAASSGRERRTRNEKRETRNEKAKQTGRLEEEEEELLALV